MQPNYDNQNPQGEVNPPAPQPIPTPQVPAAAPAQSGGAHETPQFATQSVPQQPYPPNQPQYDQSQRPGPASIQPSPQQATPKDIRQVKFLAKAIIVTSSIGLVATALSLVAGDSEPGGAANFISFATELLIGVGILNYNKAARVAFRVIGVFYIIFSLFRFVAYPLLLIMLWGVFAVNPIGGLFVILGMLINIAMFALVVFGFFLLGRKSVRALFLNNAQ